MLSDIADVTYKCSTYFERGSSAVFAMSPSPAEGVQLRVSDRDRQAPSREIAAELPF